MKEFDVNLSMINSRTLLIIIEISGYDHFGIGSRSFIRN